MVEAALNCNPINIVVAGFGEPTLIEQNSLTELAPLFLEKESKLITNGVYFPSMFERNSVPFKHIRISLDASNRKTYELIKGIDRFNTVLSNIEKYLSSNASVVGISFVVSKYNIDEVPDFLLLTFKKFFAKFPSKFYLHFKMLWSKDIAPSISQIKNVWSKVNDIRQNDLWLAFFMDTRTNYGIIRYSHSKPSWTELPTTKCYASQVQNVITTDGNIYPCFAYAHKKAMALGNIISDDIKTICEAQYHFYTHTNPKDSKLCTNCIFPELNNVLEKLLSATMVAPSLLGQISIRDTVTYHFTNNNLDFCGFEKLNVLTRIKR